MGLKQTIDQDIKQAMLGKRKEELLALRSIKSAILLAETEKGSSTALTEEQELKLLTKAAKQRKDSLEIYEKEGRNDLAEKENFEYEIIAKYLPAQLSEEDLKESVTEIIAEVGATSPADMGKVMGIATKKLAGKADGKAISGLVKQLLS